MGAKFLSGADDERTCAPPMKLTDPSPVLDKNCALKGPEFYPVPGLVLHWINISLRWKRTDMLSTIALKKGLKR